MVDPAITQSPRFQIFWFSNLEARRLLATTQPATTVAAAASADDAPTIWGIRAFLDLLFTIGSGFKVST